MPAKQKIIIVTGASSGIGKATALRLIADGHVVYGAARRREAMADIEAKGGRALAMDITDDAQVAAVVAKVMADHGRIDVLVNNAGFAIYGAVEQVPIAEARRQFEVNLFGLAAITQKVLPIMRQQGAGHIVNVSSIGGKIYTPLGAWYHATKHAVEGWSDALRVETAQFGIKVSIIEPGPIQSEFDDVMSGPMVALSKGGPYEAMANSMSAASKRQYDGSPGTKPDIIAKAISRAVRARRPKTRYPAGKLAAEILFARRWLSDRSFDGLILGMVK